MHRNPTPSPFQHQTNQYRQVTQESPPSKPFLPYQVQQQAAQAPIDSNSTENSYTAPSSLPIAPPSPPMVSPSPPPQAEPPQKAKRKTHPLLQAGSILSLWAEAAQVLIDCDNGDAALLYFHILKHNNPFPEKWDKYRAEKAQDVLHSLGLFDKKAEAKKAETAPQQTVFLAPAAPPTYSQSDINLRLQDVDQTFANLLSMAEAQFGKGFSRAQTEHLLRLYEHYGLPSDSIVLLISWCIKEHREKFGSYDLPTMNYVEGVGRNWVNEGVVTYESVANKIEAMGQNSQWEKRLLKLFRLKPHVFVDSVKKYTDVWQTWNFSDEVLLYVYDLTVSNIHEFKWAYADAILKKWFEQGFKTVAEIKEKDKNLGARPQNASQKTGQAKGQNGPRKAETRNNSFQTDDDMDLLWKSVEESQNNNNIN